MGAVTANARGAQPDRYRSYPRNVKFLFVLVYLLAVVSLALAFRVHWPVTGSRWLVWTFWAGVVAIADLLPIRLWGTISLSMSLPVALAAGMVLSPPEAGFIAFFGSLDPREFRREISVARGLYNRSQVAVSVAAASVVFHLGGATVQEWPEVLPAAVAALAADFVVNSLLVCLATSMQTRVSILGVLREMFAPNAFQFGLTYLCLGLQAPLIAAVYVGVGAHGVVAFLGPLALARHTFIQAQDLHQVAQRMESKDRALAHANALVVDERRDERMSVAGELHDEVLPPLFKVHLLGQVLRQDLANGRLLNLDDDLPELLSATQAAQEAIREIIRDLRQSALGAGGLLDTIRLLARQVEAAGGPRIQLELEPVTGSSVAQLLAYQVVREAMNNAARHARAASVQVRLWREASDIRVVVEDDGLGFDSRAVDREAHFGLQLLEERVGAVGGRAYVDSELGHGTRVVAAIPAGI